MEEKTRKLIVLYIDRDDDIGRFTGIHTPIVGRQQNVDAATSFGIASPEDSDLNSLFAAIKTFDKIQEEEPNAQWEIATITGAAEGGFKADMKLATELKNVLKVFQAEGSIIISDGPEDEKAIPLIQTYLPVLSLRRVIVQQQRSVEETYALFARYLRKIVEEPRLARIFLGIPGALLLGGIIILLTGHATPVSYAFITILGLALVVKGFSIDRFVIELWESSPIKLMTTTVSVITLSVATYLGSSSAYVMMPSQPSNIVASEFIVKSVDLYIIGLLILLGGRLIHSYLQHERGYWHTLVGIVFVLTLRLVFGELSLILAEPTRPISTLVYLLGLATVATSIVIVSFSLAYRIVGRIEKGREVKEIAAPS